MKNFFKRVFILLLFISVEVFALTLTGNQNELTTGPSALPDTAPNHFASAENLVAWIDSRQNANNINCVYASYLNDTSRQEYLIDSDEMQISEIKTDGRYIAYTLSTETGQKIRIADTANITSPALREITTSYIESFDIDSGVLVFRESANYDLSLPQTIYAVSLSDLSLTKYKVKEFFEYDYINTNIVLDGSTVAWSGEYYDDVNSIYSNYLDTADITNIANPVVTRNFLPKDSQGRYLAWINYIDTSDNWLIARGIYNDSECVFGLHNYKTPVNWSFVPIRQLENYNILPLIDFPYVVWAENNSSQPSVMESSDSSSKIIGAVLFDTGRASSSIIKNQITQDWTITSAAINNNKVIWSAAYMSQGEEYEAFSDLFADNMQLQCGDNGYLPGDINRDCKIDFQDLANLTENWLACSNPNDDTCLSGEIFD